MHISVKKENKLLTLSTYRVVGKFLILTFGVVGAIELGNRQIKDSFERLHLMSFTGLV